MEEIYLKGKTLYGDNFSEKEIEKWYKEEAEAFADLYGIRITDYTYPYHDINNLYGFSYLKNIKTFNNVLGFGASWGYEFLPVIDKIENLSIVEASQQTRSDKLGRIIPEYYTPKINGTLPYKNDSYDLVTCFDTLHHIPNVTYVLSELCRVVKPKGYLLLREPCHSMGDWNNKRKGLTKHERGISSQYMEEIIENSNMIIEQKHYFGFMGSFLQNKLPHSFIKSQSYLYLDRLFSQLFFWNCHYHETNKLQRISPINVFYVLRKI